ncbi:hypothetical protein [Clostridium tyrobutyricum]|uniref:hypothetical protein n=1 Tax=Clostridium tyrobutyricum TaxID=1519 RepID=UPI0011C8616F|nr:hypothetical protein [Clostridium tyrobutyricum]
MRYKNKMKDNILRVVNIKRKARRCKCVNCCYYHNGEDGGLEYCSMNSRVSKNEHMCKRFNRKIDGMVLYRQKQNRKKKRKNKNKQKKRNI